MHISAGHRAFHAIAVTASALLLLAGAFAAHEEVSPYLRLGTVIERAQQITPETATGLSSSSMHALLADCMGAAERGKSLEMRYDPPEVRQTILATCFDRADAIAARAPSNSYAWMTGAHMAAALGDIGSLNDRLVRSQATGPNEQWLASQRIALGETHLSDLSGLAAQAHEADLKLLVHSATGLRRVALRYVVDVGFRERMAAIVDSMPEDTQRRFLANLERAMTDAGY